MSGERHDDTHGFTRGQIVRGALGACAALSAAPLIAACGGSGSSTGSTAATLKPKKGGILRVGILGGSSSDTLDAGRIVTEPDTIRAMALYNEVADPYELHNLAGDPAYAARQQQLAAKLAVLKATAGAMAMSNHWVPNSQPEVQYDPG